MITPSFRRASILKTKSSLCSDAKEMVEILVQLSQLSYDDTGDDPCVVPSCPPALATFTHSMRFVAIGFMQPVGMAAIVITMMFLWNFCVASKTIVKLGRKTGLCCRTRHSEELPVRTCTAYHPFYQCRARPLIESVDCAVAGVFRCG